MKNKIKISVIGGGMGTIPVITALKDNPHIDFSVIVSMTDDGGSNKVVRDEFGLLPLSDLRKSIIALARHQNGEFRELFTYRFSKGNGLAGHTLGNLIMMALSDITGDEMKAIDYVRKIFGVKEKIIPVTFDDVSLVAEYDNGDIEKGEHLIDETTIYENQRIKRIFCSPKAYANKEALKSIKEADYIILGPGDLYTSTFANIIIQGIPEAIQQSNAKLIFITNLMTKAGQTRNMKISDHIKEFTRYIGREPNFVIINNGKLSKLGVERYFKEKGEKPIVNDIKKYSNSFVVINADVVASGIIEKEKGDKLIRSLIRHDPEKLKKTLKNIIKY